MSKLKWIIVGVGCLLNLGASGLLYRIIGLGVVIGMLILFTEKKRGKRGIKEYNKYKNDRR